MSKNRSHMPQRLHAADNICIPFIHSFIHSIIATKNKTLIIMSEARVPVRSRPTRTKPEPAARERILKDDTLEAVAEYINAGKGNSRARKTKKRRSKILFMEQFLFLDANSTLFSSLIYKYSQEH